MHILFLIQVGGVEITWQDKIDNKNILIVKGAPDVILSKCKNIDYDKIMNINNKWSDNAIRVLAVAQKEITEELKQVSHKQYSIDIQTLRNVLLMKVVLFTLTVLMPF